MGTWRPSDHSRGQKGGTLFEVPEQEDLSPRDRVGARPRRGGSARNSAPGVRRAHRPSPSVSPTTGRRGTAVTITGTSFNTPAVTGGHDRWCGCDVHGRQRHLDHDVRTVRCAGGPGRHHRQQRRRIIEYPDGRLHGHGLRGAPTITSFSPAGGPVGTVVTITGTNFCGATQVLFNATLATTYTVVLGDVRSPRPCRRAPRPG